MPTRRRVIRRFPDEETDMSYIEKAQILVVLRDRGMSERADWVDRQMPARIDPQKNASLLRMLRLEDEVLAAATVSG
jgi:hypothetical protein